MKKILFLSGIFIGLCSFTSSAVLSESERLDESVSIELESTNRTPVVFCSRGNAGSCDPRPDNQGFACNPGGNECGGTIIKDIR